MTNVSCPSIKIILRIASFIGMQFVLTTFSNRHQFFCYSKDLQIMTRESNPAREAISCGPLRNFINIDKMTYLRKFVYLIESHTARKMTSRKTAM